MTYRRLFYYIWSPLSQGNPIEWKQDTRRFNMALVGQSPLSQGNPIEWKPRMGLDFVLVLRKGPLSQGNPIEWKPDRLSSHFARMGFTGASPLAGEPN